MLGTMYYYEVLVSTRRYHGHKPLTYSSSAQLAQGAIVAVPLQKQIVPGIVVGTSPKPSFAVKTIEKALDGVVMPKQLIQLLEWMQAYYPAPLGQLVSLMLPSTATTEGRKALDRDNHQKLPTTLPPLTKEQQATVASIISDYPKSVLLHGDTGTGKTRVYLELIGKAIENNTSAILLTPEIGLTPQLVTICEQTFPNQTITLHSELTPAQRRDAWLRILQSTKPLIVIGPRSALFAPLKNIGLIVIDEFHDAAYKQEQAPHYVASRVAATLANLHEAQLILGSATPSIIDYYIFQTKNLPILRMQDQAIKSAAEKVPAEVVDLKDRTHFSRSSWLSDQLLAAMEASLQKKEQSLVFLNRRGTARLVMCQACGWQASCPHCDLPLTYHGDKHTMQCHTCGYHKPALTSCPSCGGHELTFRSIGTKALVSELQRLFPGASIRRFDSDALKADKLVQHYEDIHKGTVDILVGTQMLGKGLDLPRLSTLGIVVADTSLSFPDYTSEERTFQLLVQAIGRINRGHVVGKAFIQTYYPDNPVIQAVVSKTYESFYQQQLIEREQYGFPPFRHMMKLTCSRSSRASAQKASQELAAQLQKLPGIEIIGPGPAFTEKAVNRYRWHIIVGAKQRSILTDIIKNLPANWSYDIDPMNLL